MNTFEAYWKDICEIHLFTKHYILLAEELAIDGNTIIQPLKEHRDAYDHIIRVYSTRLGISDVEGDSEYLTKNMSKALGHEYRAFFDAADWITLVIRERINALLAGKERSKIEACYPNYSELREMLIKIPDEIVSIRKNKDIGKQANSRHETVCQYAEVLDKLYKSCKDLALAMEKYEE